MLFRSLDAEFAQLDAFRELHTKLETQSRFVRGLAHGIRLGAVNALAAAARVETASRDRCTEGVQLEIAEIEHELEGHLHRRRLLEKAATLLEETRATFARDHQPAVLREASRWLARLTDGHYTSITTSIHEARLEVHDRENKPWNPDRLSRGTREQDRKSTRLNSSHTVIRMPSSA